MYQWVKPLASPIVWVLLLMAFGLVLERFRSRKRLSRCGQFSVVAAALLLYLLSIPAVSGWLLYGLENRHRPPGKEVLADLDLVVILGGGYHPSGKFRASPEPNGLTYARLVGGLRAFRETRAATLALSGGGRSGETEAGVMKSLAKEFNVAPEKLITETRSYNTMTQAIELRKLLEVTAAHRIGLVTSALHMSRSERAFRAVFAEQSIVPIPVGYRYSPSEGLLDHLTPSARSLAVSTEAIHEWIGMAWYVVRYGSRP
ncbi:MAG: YdcF family protein [Phycisphaerales bacterium]|nr:MAG: YdcF family protein [Phycisphaerales bacterium]